MSDIVGKLIGALARLPGDIFGQFVGGVADGSGATAAANGIKRKLLSEVLTPLTKYVS